MTIADPQVEKRPEVAEPDLSKSDKSRQSVRTLNPSGRFCSHRN